MSLLVRWDEFMAFDNSLPTRQQTLKSRIHCSGIGLHSGKAVSLALNPADIDTGIVFIRTDVRDRNPIIPARWDQVVDTRMCTVVGNDEGVTVGTVEHLMAALSGAGIDNARIELDGPEVPIMDGSAEPFVFLIDCAGIVEQRAPRQAIKILRRIAVGDESRGAAFAPSAEPAYSFEIEFDSPAIRRQRCSLKLVNGTFRHELSKARTFGFMDEVEGLKKIGLARGGSLENAVVVNGDRVLNEGGLRYSDEFVRHKILDSVGDLYLAGAPIIGQFQGARSGHAHNNQLLRALFAAPDSWRFVDMGQIQAESRRFSERISA